MLACLAKSGLFLLPNRHQILYMYTVVTRYSWLFFCLFVFYYVETIMFTHPGCIKIDDFSFNKYFSGPSL